MRRATWAWIALLLAVPASAEQPLFHVLELPSDGRTAAAGFADLDGDGRTDLYAVTLSGIPPRQRRELRVHFQSGDGTLSREPDWSGPIARDAAAFDVAELDAAPGAEFLQLRRHAIGVISFPERAAQRRDLMIPGDPTAAVGADERGIDRLRMARMLGDRLRLLVPGLGECIVLERDGALVARLDSGQRTNYYIPKRPGPLLGESEFESYFDFPRVEVGDVDGDGRDDLIFASRHELRVFFQSPEGRFAPIADRSVALNRLSEKDLIRGSGNVRVAAADVDGDARVDLIITSTVGGLMNARSETTVHRNRNGAWDLDAPDRRTVDESAWSALQLADVDGDGGSELVVVRMPLGLLEFVAILLTREVDVESAIFDSDPQNGFALEPLHRFDLNAEIDFETTSLRGFAPTIEADLNGDGIPDRVGSDGDAAIEVHLGGGPKPFQALGGRQELDAHGSIRFGDLDGDSLTDALLFARDRPDAPIRILVNLGQLPGTRKPTRVGPRD